MRDENMNTLQISFDKDTKELSFESDLFDVFDDTCTITITHDNHIHLDREFLSELNHSNTCYRDKKLFIQFEFAITDMINFELSTNSLRFKYFNASINKCQEELFEFNDSFYQMIYISHEPIISDEYDLLKGESNG